MPESIPTERRLMRLNSRSTFVAIAAGAVLMLTGACNHKGDDVDTDPGGGNDVPGENEGGEDGEEGGEGGED
jgi:hypothetical protein